MEWFYSKNNEQKGPVSAAEMLSLHEQGVFSGDSLVWTEQQTDWKPYREVVEAIYAAAGKGKVETAVCAHSGQVLEKKDMVPYGDGWVAPEHKEQFVQRLMEGERLDLNEAGQFAMRYVGFWWRVLASVIDYFVKMIPILICQIPYYLALFANAAKAGKEGGADPADPLSIWTTGVVITYGIAMVGQLAVSIFYDTWMVGKYQATVGKMAIGAVVVDPEGRKISYSRSFGRWAAKKLLNGAILTMVVTVPIVLVLVFGTGMMAGGGAEGMNPESLIGIGVLMGGILLVVYPLALFPYWMCGRDKEKRTLHDRVSGTRVIKKELPQ
ncbi:MAG: RDD family protein [Verrucomicrobiales bacterium]|nr:RDD family protein [Verrucomicrobiales bacterium]